MPPLLQQVRGATVLTIYMTDTPSNLPVAYTNMQTTSVHDKMHHRGWRGVRVFFHPEREKSLPEINPCLRVLIPSPSWIGLTHFDSFFFFAPQFWANTTASSQIASRPFIWSYDGLLDSLLRYRKYIFSSLASSSPYSLSPSPLCFLSLSFFAFHFFTGNCCCCILWEWGIFFTWVSVEKGGQSIKFELLKTTSTSLCSGLDPVPCMNCFWRSHNLSFFLFPLWSEWNWIYITFCVSEI